MLDNRNNAWKIPFSHTLRIFGIRRRTQHEAEALETYLLSRADGNHRLAAQLFIGDEYALTIGRLHDSGMSLEAFLRDTLGQRRYEIAKNWDLF